MKIQIDNENDVQQTSDEVVEAKQRKLIDDIEDLDRDMSMIGTGYLEY